MFWFGQYISLLLELVEIHAVTVFTQTHTRNTMRSRCRTTIVRHVLCVRYTLYCYVLLLFIELRFRLPRQLRNNGWNVRQSKHSWHWFQLLESSFSAMDDAQLKSVPSISMHEFLDFLKISCQLQESIEHGNSGNATGSNIDYNSLAQNDLVNSLLNGKSTPSPRVDSGDSVCG